ncbi:anaphase-promoting complex subunit 7 [Oratosquilla oratoria]|uniref:anaphase-promoting complex subunit 7 n=1 Tax=Oratosquilla oratoria TaxID=337810 RepID=UPI003F762162
MCLFEQIKVLHENGLHSNLVALGSLVLTVSENQPDVLSSPWRYQTMVYMGKALQQQGEHRRADAMYKKALQFVKAVTKTKTCKTTDLFKEGVSEVDVKYAMAECNMAVRQFTQALNVLESIPQRHRTSKVMMTLGRLYQQIGMERPAITAYKEVLRECPLALEAVQGLLSLGVRGAEVASLMINVSNNTMCTEWLSLWVKGHAHLHARDYTSAITSFRQLEENSPLRHNADILATLGETHYLAGDTKNALSTLERAHTIDPLNLRGIDLLACLYASEKQQRELEALSMAATSVTDSAPQPWITIGYYCHLTKRPTKAIYFAHKACSINPRSVEGLLLKGTLLLELKKLQEAVMHFREAMQIAPHRFEPHKGLVDCYLAMHRSREAVTIASNACKLLGQTPRALTLYASVLLKDTLTVSKGKSLLEKALKEDPYYLPAVYLLCDIYEQDMRFDAAIELLRKQVAVQSTCRLHQMLADLLSRVHEEEKAAYHYSVALNLDPGNSRVIEGMQKMEAATDAIDTTPYDMEVEDIADSEGEVEESDLEAVWSDVDFSFSGQ